MPQEDWELASGLREEVTFDILLAMFGYRANYNNGSSLLLILTGTDENGEAFEHICSVGGDWVSPDGKHAQHPSGKNRINKQSRYGQWITACQSIPPLWTFLTNSVGPTDASIWENLRLHLQLQNVAQTIRGESVNKDILLPDALVGFLDPNQVNPVPVLQPMMQQSVQQMAPVLPLQVPTQPVMPTLVPVAPVGATPEQMLLAAQQAAGVATAESPIRNQLREIARVSTDHSTFVSQAFAIQGVVTDQALVKELMEPNDFYAKARVG